MDDALTDKAIRRELSMERFGSGDNEKAKSLYKIFLNDCNDYTVAVFNEYKRLWINDQAPKNKNNAKFDVKAWDEHYKDLTKRRGEYVDLTPTEAEK